jgi:hypothetical protein
MEWITKVIVFNGRMSRTEKYREMTGKKYGENTGVIKKTKWVTSYFDFFFSTISAPHH